MMDKTAKELFSKGRFNINEFILIKLEEDLELSFKSLATFADTASKELGFGATLKTLKNLKTMYVEGDSVRVVVAVSKNDVEHELDKTWSKEELLASPQPMSTMLLVEMISLLAQEKW